MFCHVLRQPAARLFPALATVLLAAAHAPAQSFAQGELLLSSTLLPVSGGTPGGIVRIDPVTGVTTTIVDLAQPQSHQDTIAYDPYRDAILVSAALQAGSPRLLHTIDASGSAQSLGFQNQQIRALAPTGDGRVYLRTDGVPGRVWYLDSQDQMQQLLDASGTGPFEFEPGGTYDYRVLHYDALTRSLFAAAPSVQRDCTTGAFTPGVSVRRVTLSADGSQVEGPVLCADFEVSTSDELPVGLSVMGDGALLLVVDTSSVLEEPRMLYVDPLTLAISEFARNGNPSAAATSAGTWSSSLGRAVILDSGGNALLTYAQGETGLGTPLSTSAPVSGTGAGEPATLIEITSLPCAGSYRNYGQGLSGSGGFEPTLTATGCPLGGTVIDLHARGMPTGAAGFLFVGTSPVALPILSGTLLTVPLITVPVFAGGPAPGGPGQGVLDVPLPLPASPAIQGFTAYLQTVFADTGAASGLSFTGGLAITIG